jgi:hypothetical protein
VVVLLAALLAVVLPLPEVVSLVVPLVVVLPLLEVVLVVVLPQLVEVL